MLGDSRSFKQTFYIVMLIQGDIWASRCCQICQCWLKQTIVAARKPIDKGDSNMCDHWEQWTTIIIKHQSWNIKHHQTSSNIKQHHQSSNNAINDQFFEHDWIFKCHLKPNTPFFICFHMFNSTKTPKKQGISLPLFQFLRPLRSLAMKRKKPPDPTDAPKCKEEVNSWEAFRIGEATYGRSSDSPLSNWWYIHIYVYIKLKITMVKLKIHLFFWEKGKDSEASLHFKQLKETSIYVI